MAGATLVDWLALHGLSAAECRARLQPDSRAHPPAPDPAFAQADVLPTVLAALRNALPDAASVLDRINNDVRIDLNPDTQRFPRAFTLHVDGRGLPFISCPLKGRCSDLLLLAHEIGHACQSLANGKTDLPPMQRETAAYLAEELVCAASGLALRAVHQARTARIMARDGAVLLDALDTPNAAYHYNWSYPLARDLAARAVMHLDSAAHWQLFTGGVDLAQLLRLPLA
jgi:hypothetical protein